MNGALTKMRKVISFTRRHLCLLTFLVLVLIVIYWDNNSLKEPFQIKSFASRERSKSQHNSISDKETNLNSEWEQLNRFMFSHREEAFYLANEKLIKLFLLVNAKYN